MKTNLNKDDGTWVEVHKTNYWNGEVLRTRYERKDVYDVNASGPLIKTPIQYTGPYDLEVNHIPCLVVDKVYIGDLEADNYRCALTYKKFKGHGYEYYGFVDSYGKTQYPVQIGIPKRDVYPEQYGSPTGPNIDFEDYIEDGDYVKIENLGEL